MTEMDAATKRFENELTGLIERHGSGLTDNQVITVLERALDEAFVIAGDIEPSKKREEMIAALKPFADLGVGSGPDYEVESYRLTRASILRARAVLAA
jgi:hypothetical protein